MQFEKLIKKLCDVLEVEGISEPNQIQSHTAINITQNTNKGKLFIRVYPKFSRKLETGHVMFEIQALSFFSSKGINVPVPLTLGKNLYLEIENQIIFAYFYLHGTPIRRSELSVDLAKNIGLFLHKILEISVKYSREVINEEPFLNSFEYIVQIADKIEKEIPYLKNLEIWNSMKERTKMHVNILNGSPKGILHADYYYENILKDEMGNVVGLIDFGDAYYGYILHDVTIGAMEACVLENEIWNLEIFNAFIKASSPFLIKNSISFEQFFETLMADCLRFAIYTISDTLKCKKDLKSNIYIGRYEKLLSKNFKEKLFEIYNLFVLCNKNLKFY
ncbi:APH domain-containing protein [Trichonephila clavipes]|nr:APH domain-containing protein [Trichonephila clavipes]